MTWTVEHRDGHYHILDERGRLRGLFSEPEVMATHLAMSMQKIDEQDAQISKLIDAAQRDGNVTAHVGVVVNRILEGGG